MDAPPLSELALNWLRLKTVSAATDTANSDAARRSDLAWWGRKLSGNNNAGRLDVAADLASLSLDQLSRTHILEVLYASRGTLRSTTLRRRLSTLRSFCRHLSASGLLSLNPFDDPDLRIAPPAEAEPKSVTGDELERLLIAAANPPPKARSAWPSRDVALLTLIAKTGVRAAECAALQWGDVDLDDPAMLRVRRATKSGRGRNVPLGSSTLAALDTMRHSYAAAGFSTAEDSLLFRKRSGVGFKIHDLHYLLQRVAAHANVTLPDDAAVHALRHHFGMELATRRVPLPLISQMMGHADPRTTSIYTRQRSADLADALEDAGWL